jgi:large subunit ribosomal protein L17
MHRHGYKGRKFGRERDQREALIKGLADALVLNETIETTLPKAKEVARYTEKLITKAKKGDIHNRRLIISALATKAAAHKMVDELAPKLTARNSGYFRIERTELRRGDNSQMARISFVDDLKVEIKPAKAEPKVVAKVAAPRKRTAKPAGDKV